jgi:hypothetical protein
MDAGNIADTILTAMKGVLAGSWESVAGLAAGEAQKLAQTLISIETMSAEGTTTPAQATILLDMQTHATRAVLLSVEGIGLLVAQQAIDAGLTAVGTIVDKAVGFTLI